GGLAPDLKVLSGEELAGLVPACSSDGEESQSQRESPRVPAPVYGSRGAVESRAPPPSALQETYHRGQQPGSAHAKTGTSYGAPAAFLNEQNTPRPQPSIIPGQEDPRVTGSTGGGGDPRNMAAFPPDVRPEIGPKKELAPQFRRTLVDYYTKEPAGTIIIDTPNTYLYLVLGNGKALRYGVGVGREG